MFTSLFLRMLNREAASPKNTPGEVLASLQMREGFTAADIGSGGGYYTLELAKAVGNNGQVYAVDVDRRNLDFIKRQAEREGIGNISYVLAAQDSADLPVAGLDLIFLRNAFHHLPEPGTYLRNAKRFLKPSGRVAIVEHKPSGAFGFAARHRHYWSPEAILREMESAGYRLVQSLDFLPSYAFYSFWVADAQT